MNIHKNARTPANRRVLIVARLRAGETPRSIAGAVSIAGAGGVSRATVRKWLRRHESEGVAGLEDRTSRPMHNPQTCPEMEGGGIIYLNHISSCAVHWITDPTAQAVCSLTAESLRAFDAKLHNHLLRPKMAQFLFSR